MSSILKNKTFEVPACTVCMEEMTENLASIGCGHVFHSLCITQSLEYRSACPNCRKRSTAKEIRELTFAVAVTKLEDTDRIQFLDSLKQADQENYLKLISQNEEMYKEVKTKTNKIAELKEEIENKENLLVSQGEMIRALNDLKSTWKIEKRALEMQKATVELENEKIIKVNRELEKRVNTLERETKDYERLKKVVDNANDNEDEFLKSLKERSSPQEQAKTFYEFLRIKKGELKKAKDELQKMSSELSLYKGKVSALESALKQQKSQAEKPVEKRFDMPADLKRRVSLDEKIIPEKTIRSVKPQSRLDLDTTDLLLNKGLHSELDFAMLEKDMLNTSFRDLKDRTNETQETTKKPEMIRPMKSLIYPPGMTKTTPEVKSINKWTSATATSGLSFNKFPTVKPGANEQARVKQTDFMDLKKVKLNNEQIGLKPNVQQKISSLFAPNN